MVVHSTGSWLRRARALDDRVLGASDSRRGWLVNLALGLHPVLARIWFAVAALLVVASVARAATGRDWGATLSGAVFCLFLGYGGRRLPARWRG